MAVLTLAINTKDNSSNVISNVANSFSKLSNVVETAKNSVKSAGGGFLNLTAGLGGIITIVNTAINIFKKVDDAFKKMGGEGADAWNELKAVFSTITKIIADTLLPVISSIVRGISAFVKSAEGLKFISSLAGSISAGFIILKNVFEILYNIIKDTILNAFRDISARMSEANDKSDMLTSGLNVLKGIVIALSVAFNVSVNIIKTLIIAIIDLVEVVKSAGELLGNIFTGQWDKVGESAKKVSDSFSKLTGNLKDNFSDIVSSAVKTADDINKKFDVKKISDDTKKAFSDTRKNVETSLKSMKTDFSETNDEIREEALVFTSELKNAYLEYSKIKEDINNKNFKNEQDYFDKLAKLQELSKIKGIKELEEYYSKSEKIVEAKQSSIISKISKTLEGFDFNKYLTDIENNFSKLTNAIFLSLNSMVTNIIKSFSNVKDEIEKINNSNLSDTEKTVEKMKVLFGAIGNTIAAVFQTSGQVINASFGFYRTQLDGEIKQIENKYSEMLNNLNSLKERDLAKVDEYIKAELEKIGEGAKSELEIAQEKLEELKALREDFRDEETEQRLQELEEYYQALDNKTDADITAAYERQKAKILETEEKKRLDLEEQISAQQKEVAKVRIMEEANKKKAEIEANYEKKKLEAEKQRQNELNEKEKQIFEANKANQIANVWIATGVGIATAWASAMQLGPIAGPIVGAVLST
ncbi:MAG: hypothetical protein GYA14_13805, partial [Ignavibacteria bacterium]|nr:hypothetical protein [Ignavibacteria bacterium]